MLGNQMNRTPIRFLREEGVYNVPPGIPVIRVMFFKSRVEHEGQVTWSVMSEDWRKIWALVDTGAEQSVIDTSFALRLGLVPHVGRNILAQGVNGTSVEQVFDFKVLFIEGLTELTTEAISSPLVEHGSACPLIIGMSTICQGRLVMDFREAEFYYEAYKKGGSEGQ